MPASTLVWLRHDLRLADNPALAHAAERDAAVVPLFAWAPDEEGDWPPGGAHRWWLHHSLDALAESLEGKTSRLILRTGSSLDALRDVIATTGADAVYWNARYEPALRERDRTVAEALRQDGIIVKTFASRLLHDPDAVRTQAGDPYRVFTPFYRTFLDTVEIGEPLNVPRLGAGSAPETWPKSTPLDDLGLLPEAQDGVDWAGTMREAWTPGERGAHRRLHAFLDRLILDYADARDRPAEDGTSRLSPHLHWGEISPRQVWQRAQNWVRNGSMREAADAFLRELVWREFAYHSLYHVPSLPSEPLQEKFAAFEWAEDAEALRRWQHGQTGYPFVDAGMRELWATGWMHNRARMVAGSFLTKDLRLPWQQGEAWFWDTLVDGDLASNALNWQWVAGSGPDAQPFFRIFNPVSQGEKHDPDGTYVRRWVPELAGLPDDYLHHPWDAPDDALAEAGVVLGETYPEPIVDHAEARDRALAAYQKIK